MQDWGAGTMTAGWPLCAQRSDGGAPPLPMCTALLLSLWRLVCVACPVAQVTMPPMLKFLTLGFDLGSLSITVRACMRFARLCGPVRVCGGGGGGVLRPGQPQHHGACLHAVCTPLRPCACVWWWWWWGASTWAASASRCVLACGLHASAALCVCVVVVVVGCFDLGSLSITVRACMRFARLCGPVRVCGGGGGGVLRPGQPQHHGACLHAVCTPLRPCACVWWWWWWGASTWAASASRCVLACGLHASAALCVCVVVVVVGCFDLGSLSITVRRATRLRARAELSSAAPPSLGPTR